MRTPFACLIIVALLQLPACAPHVAVVEEADSQSTLPDNSILWIQHAVEFRAVARQAYAEAGRDLDGFLADSGWTALPGVTADA
ncbi:MAG: hypothetical protein AAFN50_07075, partial [Pseudomonadota bacterium]